MRQLYVTTAGLKPRLLGILSEIKPASNADPFHSDGEYMFEYTLGGEFPSKLTRVFGLDNPTGAYKGYIVHKNILSHFLPPDNCRPFFNDALKQFRMTKYDEWQWLKAQCGKNVNHEIKIYDILPEDIIAYQTIPALKTDENDKDITD